MNAAIGGGSGGDTQPPTAPTGLTANAVGSSQINLSWTAATDNVGVTGYRVERCQGAGCSNFAQIATPTGTSFNDTGLSASTSYSYRVRAVDAAGNLGPYSNTATVTTSGATDTQAPTAPASLTATAASSSQINLSWPAATDNVGVTGYRIERCQGAGCSNFAQIATPTGTSFNDTGLSASTSYSYRVRATDAAGNLGPYSPTATATTQSGGGGLTAVAAYSFNEGSGTTVTDASGTGNIGTIGTATWSTQGKYGGALAFNGTSAKVTILDAPSLRLTNAMTLEAWVFPTSASSAWQDAVYKGTDNYYLSASSCCSGLPVGGGIFSGTYGEAYGASALAVNTWTHLAATYDGSTLRLYVNGVQVASKAQTGTLATSAGVLTIGGDPIYGQYFAGRIDEVRVYSTALTPAQVQADMNTAIP
jgi:chitodextrinase